MVKEDRNEWKAKYFTKVISLLDEYPKCFIVGADNVGSSQMQKIRISLRGHAVLLMGKNTMMRKAIKGHLEKNPNLERLLPHIFENVGFVFTKEDLTFVRDKLSNNKVILSIFFATHLSFPPCYFDRRNLKLIRCLTKGCCTSKSRRYCSMRCRLASSSHNTGPRKDKFFPSLANNNQDHKGCHRNCQRCQLDHKGQQGRCQ